uniref:Uncharacterized protein n=1 Tax=Scleropages formosus TaxID=113540 RepID=A0A8C9W8T6_SCLFO
MQKSTMGIYVINKEGAETGHYDDIASAMMLGVIYALNMAYPKHLKYYYEFIQKVLFRMDSERRSPRILGLKNKISAGLGQEWGCYFLLMVLVHFVLRS